jgi:hypothetical protein
MDVKVLCPDCSHRFRQSIAFPNPILVCPHCSATPLKHPTQTFTEGTALNQCPICGSSHLYHRKDFSQKLGIVLVVLGVALAYFTYGLSLLVVTLIDFFLFKRTHEVGICYQCQSEFRKSELITQLEPFDLQLFDYYRSLKP